MTLSSKLVALAIVIGFSTSQVASSSAATLTVAPDQSYLQFSIAFGVSDPQFQGSDRAALAGSFEVDLTAGTIAFPGGISVTLLDQPNPIEPVPGGLPGSAAANVGMVNLVPGGSGVVAIRDSVLALSASGGVVVGSGFSSAMDAVFTSGTVDVNYDLSLGPHPNIYGSAAFDSTLYPAASGGTLEIAGTLVTLTIPVEFYVELAGFQFNAGSIGTLPLLIQGEIVATGLIPEPSSSILSIIGTVACVGVALRRRK